MKLQPMGSTSVRTLSHLWGGLAIFFIRDASAAPVLHRFILIPRHCRQRDRSGAAGCCAEAVARLCTEANV
jgi:hypothetical protein